MALYYSNGQWVYQKEKDDYPTYANEGLKDEELLPTNLTKTVKTFQKGQPITLTVPDYEQNNKNEEKNEKIKAKNQINKQKNKANKTKNSEAVNQNQYEAEAWQVINGTKGGDYLQQISKVQNSPWGGTELGKNIKDSFDTWYKETKTTPWDTAKGAQPPNSKEKGFDYKYYVEQNPEVLEKWEAAKASGDLDILATYPTLSSFALSDYTFVGKPAGKRGNAAELLSIADSYVEKAPTDAEKQNIKDNILGISYENLKGYTGGVGGKGATTLEDILGTEIGADTIKKTNQFGALKQDTLKATIEEMKKAKQKETMLGMFNNTSVGEVFNYKKALADNLLGDSGIGGILSTIGDKKTLTKIEKGLQGLTGANNNILYNWEKWFNDTLTKKYSEELELQAEDKETQEKIKIESEFAKEYIEKYLAPKFNASKSMNQFIEYINVDDEFQNPLQTQDVINKAVEVAQGQNKIFLDQIEAMKDGTFNSEFYFNPSNNLKSQEAIKLEKNKEAYEEQAKQVAADWEEAKKQVQKQDGYWYEQAYKYGVDVNDKNAFAKLHYQTVGNQKGFDPVENFATNEKFVDYIYTQVLPAIKDSTADMSIFGNFLKPEDLTKQITTAYGVDSEDKTTWKEIMEKFNIKDFEGSFADLESYLTDVFSGNTALEIQKNIKDLKKEGITPTQENLGIYYIPKEEDKLTEEEEKASSKTALYSIFKSAGYQGSEDSFYEEFFPDLSKQEQELLLGKEGLGAGIKGFLDLDLSDPYGAIGNIEELLKEEDDKDFSSTLFSFEKDEDQEDEESIFSLKFDDDDENLFKYKTGSDILSDFTSFF